MAKNRYCYVVFHKKEIKVGTASTFWFISIHDFHNLYRRGVVRYAMNANKTVLSDLLFFSQKRYFYIILILITQTDLENNQLQYLIWMSYFFFLQNIPLTNSNYYIVSYDLLRWFEMFVLPFLHVFDNYEVKFTSYHYIKNLTLFTFWTYNVCMICVLIKPIISFKYFQSSEHRVFDWTDIVN